MKLAVLALALFGAVAHGGDAASGRALAAGKKLAVGMDDTVSAATDDVPDSVADDSHSGVGMDDEASSGPVGDDTTQTQSSKNKKKVTSSDDDDSSDKKKTTSSDDDSSDNKHKKKKVTTTTTTAPTVFPTYAPSTFPTYAPTTAADRAIKTDDTVKYGVAGDDDTVAARTDAGDDGSDDVSNHPVGKRHKKNQENRDQGDDDIANPMQDDGSSHAIFGKDKSSEGVKSGVSKLAAAQGVGGVAAQEAEDADADDAHLTVVDPDQLNNTAAYFPDGANGTAATTTDDDTTLADDHAAASTTCKSNDDCPRGSSGDIYRCIEGSCKDSGITATEGVYSPFDGDLTTDDWLALAARTRTSPSARASRAGISSRRGARGTCLQPIHSFGSHLSTSAPVHCSIERRARGGCTVTWG